MDCEQLRVKQIITRGAIRATSKSTESVRGMFVLMGSHGECIIIRCSLVAAYCIQRLVERN